MSYKKEKSINKLEGYKTISKYSGIYLKVVLCPTSPAPNNHFLHVIAVNAVCETLINLVAKNYADVVVRYLPVHLNLST